MAKITKIKASDTPRKHTEEESVITRKKVVVKDKKTEKNKRIEKKKAEVEIGSEKPKKKTFILFRPFVAFFRYLRDSWRELRQVRWPNNKTTWKMLLAVLVYTLLFVVFITLLDLLFSWIFGLLLGNK